MIIYQPIKSSVTPPLDEKVPVFTVNGEQWWLASVHVIDPKDMKGYISDLFPMPKNERNKKGAGEAKKLREAYLNGFKFLHGELKSIQNRSLLPTEYVEIG